MERDKSPKRKKQKSLRLSYWITYFFLELELSENIVDTCFQNLKFSFRSNQKLNYVKDDLVRPLVKKYLPCRNDVESGFAYAFSDNSLQILLLSAKPDTDMYRLWEFTWGLSDSFKDLNLFMFGETTTSGRGVAWKTFFCETLDEVCQWTFALNLVFQKLKSSWNLTELFWKRIGDTEYPKIECSHCQLQVFFTPECMIMTEKGAKYYRHSLHRAIIREGQTIYFGNGEPFHDAHEYAAHIAQLLNNH